MRKVLDSTNDGPLDPTRYPWCVGQASLDPTKPSTVAGCSHFPGGERGERARPGTAGSHSGTGECTRAIDSMGRRKSKDTPTVVVVVARLPLPLPVL